MYTVSVLQRERIRLFVTEILAWYKRHRRTLPWRDITETDPLERLYKILVSEIMLQQTQVPRVIHAYRRFLETFPSITKLAQASNADVILAWRGMGYNSRALRLRDAARVIEGRKGTIRHGKGIKGEKEEKGSMEDIKKKNGRNVCRQRNSALHDSAFSIPYSHIPMSMTDLMALPGVGHYTAAAVRNFAFHLPTACIDTNIRRILHRTFVGPERADGTWQKDDTYLLALAEEILQEVLSSTPLSTSTTSSASITFSTSTTSSTSITSDWHAALMDYGSMVQTKSNPRWDICPLSAKGIMKTTKMSFERSMKLLAQTRRNTKVRREPGREVAGRFVPNRIFRGRIIDVLRDEPKGCTFAKIGSHICVDWNQVEHEQWLTGLLERLIEDRLIAQRRNRYALAQ
jgi:A/G-specific adenine glycosylase